MGIKTRSKDTARILELQRMLFMKRRNATGKQGGELVHEAKPHSTRKTAKELKDQGVVELPSQNELDPDSGGEE